MAYAILASQSVDTASQREEGSTTTISLPTLNVGPKYLFRQELYRRHAEYDSLLLVAVVQEALYHSDL